MTNHELTILNKVKSVLPFVQPDERFAGKSDSPLCGLCHPSAVVLYRLLGGKDRGYKLQKAVDRKGFMHYWVVSASGYILDPTEEQYANFEEVPPYAHGTTKNASYRMPKAGFNIMSLLTLPQTEPL